MAEEDIHGALECIEHHPMRDVVHIRPGTGQRFWQHLSNLVDNKTNFDTQEHKMTKQTMIAAMHDLLLDVAEELQNNPDQDPVDTFERQKSQMLRQTIGTGLTKYTLPSR